MAAARGFLNIVQPAQKSNRKFVEYYLLTFSRKYDIIISESEVNTYEKISISIPNGYDITVKANGTVMTNGKSFEVKTRRCC